MIYQKAFGIADKERGLPVTDSTAFQLASVSKVITATAVMMLVERGLVKLDDTFASYFPEFPYEKVTVKHLLSHRSGLPNYLYFLNDLFSAKTNVLTNKEVLKLMAKRKPKPCPGDKSWPDGPARFTGMLPRWSAVIICTVGRLKKGTASSAALLSMNCKNLA